MNKQLECAVEADGRGGKARGSSQVDDVAVNKVDLSRTAGTDVFAGRGRVTGGGDSDGSSLLGQAFGSEQVWIGGRGAGRGREERAVCAAQNGGGLGGDGGEELALGHQGAVRAVQQSGERVDAGVHHELLELAG